MAEAIARYSEPVFTGIELTLTKDEAEKLTEFLAATSILTVEEVLDSATRDEQRDINGVLYEVYRALHISLGGKE
jgi:hypothetical protein